MADELFGKSQPPFNYHQLLYIDKYGREVYFKYNMLTEINFRSYIYHT